jgi:hypothetical protein
MSSHADQGTTRWLEIAGARNIRGIIRYEHHVRYIYRHIRASSDSYPDFCLSKRASIVHSVACHSDHVPFRLKV